MAAKETWLCVLYLIRPRYDDDGVRWSWIPPRLNCLATSTRARCWSLGRTMSCGARSRVAGSSVQTGALRCVVTIVIIEQASLEMLEICTMKTGESQQAACACVRACGRACMRASHAFVGTHVRLWHLPRELEVVMTIDW